jgi:HD-like signal output (HDOD) protein
MVSNGYPPDPGRRKCRPYMCYTSSMQDEKFQALEQLPQFPSIATKVLRVLSHEDARVQEISGLIRADASLASELLRLVNSPLYGLTTRVGSIDRALTILGFDDVRTFVLTASTKSFFQAAMRLDLVRGVWRHSVACALICEELSVACSASQGRDDRAYTAGLLHDIGRLGLFSVYPLEYAMLLTGPPVDGDILERERQAFGVDHCEAGAWLAKHWGLPDEVALVAGGHHAPPGSEPFDLEGLVRVGVLLTDSLGFDVAPPARTYKLGELRAMLPHAAQYRFNPDEETLQARIREKLDAFD